MTSMKLRLAMAVVAITVVALPAPLASQGFCHTCQPSGSCVVCITNVTNGIVECRTVGCGCALINEETCPITFAAISAHGSVLTNSQAKLEMVSESDGLAVGRACSGAIVARRYTEPAAHRIRQQTRKLVI